MKNKWYLSHWFIAFLFFLWPIYGIPLIIGIILAVLKTYENKKSKSEFTKLEDMYLELKNSYQDLENSKKELETTYQELSQKYSYIGGLDYDALQNKKAAIQEMTDSLSSTISRQKQELDELNNSVKKKKEEIIELDDKILLQEFGVYAPMYDLISSEEYKARIDEIRRIQKDMIKSDTACTHPTAFELNGSLAKGKKMVSDNIKQILRSFNNECDAIIDKVKFNNIESIRKRIQKSYDDLNKMNSALNIAIAPRYLSHKIEELNLCYEYAVKKQEEKEEQRQIREQMREEAKLQKEIEEERKRIQKEQTHYQNALKQINNQLKHAHENDKAEIEAKRNEIVSHLNEIQTSIENVDYRAANKRAGYVYIISNIGSFGENVYKIGMTRRLEPTERVDELGDASVPFTFDIHAMIFSDDAPTLETALHKAFENKKVNMVNPRREFFNVTLEEIEEVVKQNFDKTVEFTYTATAAQYRESLMIKKALAQN